MGSYTVFSQDEVDKNAAEQKTEVVKEKVEVKENLVVDEEDIDVLVDKL